MNKTLVVVAAIILVIGIAAGILILSNKKKDVSDNNDNHANSNNTTNNTTTNTTTPPSSNTIDSETANDTFEYTDGTYEADGSYTSPAGTESIGVSLTVKDDVVTAVTVTSKAKDNQSKLYQSLFVKGISGEVVGKNLDGLSVGKVNGSSLTGNGFNKAITTIKAEAEI